MLMLPITEFDIQALVDSNLTSEEEKQVWREIYKNPSFEVYYQQLIAQKKILVAWWLNEAANKDEETPVC